MFVVISKEKGMKTPQIQAEFTRKWPNSSAPSRKTIFNLRNVLEKHNNLLDKRSVSSGPKNSVRTRESIEAVKEVLENEKQRTPDQPGSSYRRNSLQLPKSPKDHQSGLGVQALQDCQEAEPDNGNVVMRVQMGLSTKPLSYFENLLVSDGLLWGAM